MGSSWEYEWSEEFRRYYFQDKITGRSCWSRPVGCTLTLPRKPPQDVPGGRPKPPPTPQELPGDWVAVLDKRPEVNRYYYYRMSKPEERTWFRPLLESEDDSLAELAAHSADTGAMHGRKAMQWTARSAATPTSMPKDRSKSNASLRSHHKYDVSFTDDCMRIRSERKEQQREHLEQELIKAVAVANRELVARSDVITVPISYSVPFSDVEAAVHGSVLESFNSAPKVTFADSTLASAVLLFKTQDRRRRICVINCAHGAAPAGEYKEGGRGQESDLCSQMANLHQSLTLGNEKKKIYPFGPAQCMPGNTASFSDGIYSPDCVVVRGSFQQDFQYLSESQHVTVPVFSVAAPLQDGVDLRLDAKQLREQLENTVASIFVTPVCQDAHCTTLILGAWGSGKEFAVKTKVVAEIFAEFLAGKVVGNVRPAWLWNEVHFCFPHIEHHARREGGHRQNVHQHHDNEPDGQIFRRAFDRARIRHTEL